MYTSDLGRWRFTPCHEGFRVSRRSAVNLFTQNINIIFQFLPGFITAGIFYTLTAHPKATEFERVVQALIFTVLLKAFLFPIHVALLFVGSRWFSLAEWTSDVELLWMTVLSVPLGLVVAWFANTDKMHQWARARELTSRTSYPSEWNAAFSRNRTRFIILHLDGNRRLYGWPEEWPDQPDKGHFIIMCPAWVLEDSTKIPIPQTNRFLIPAKEVERVEFVSPIDEYNISNEELKCIQSPLIELHRSPKDGSQATESDTGQPEAAAPPSNGTGQEHSPIRAD